MTPWYAIRAHADVADLEIRGVIGDLDGSPGTSTSAHQFLADLRALPSTVKTIRVALSSPGGSPWDATDIANALREHKVRVEITIGALAASAATLVVMGGNVVTIAKNGLAMLHNPHALVLGDAPGLRDMATALDKIKSAMLDTYRWRMRKSRDELAKLMDATTWFDATEAIAAGIADRVASAPAAEARFDGRMLARLGPAPARFAARIAVLATPRPAGRISITEMYDHFNRPRPLNVSEIYRTRNQGANR